MLCREDRQQKGRNHGSMVLSAIQGAVSESGSRRPLMSQTVSPRETSASVRLADCVIRAGAIYSMAKDRKVYRSIALRDEWIVAVSTDLHGLDELVTADTHVVDDPGITIIPAFDDDHNHFILAAENL